MDEKSLWWLFSIKSNWEVYERVKVEVKIDFYEQKKKRKKWIQVASQWIHFVPKKATGDVQDSVIWEAHVCSPNATRWTKHLPRQLSLISVISREKVARNVSYFRNAFSSSTSRVAFISLSLFLFFLLFFHQQFSPQFFYHFLLIFTYNLFHNFYYNFVIFN